MLSDLFGLSRRQERQEQEQRRTRMDAARSAINVMLDAARSLPGLNDGDARPERVERPLKPHEALPSEVIWRIPLTGQRSVYMSLAGIQSNGPSDVRMVVNVRMREFYGAWRAAEWASDGSQGTRPPAVADIPQDRKWKGQGPNWAAGIENPVPLAEVGYHETVGIRFVDGVTRTLWLAHNGARSFPVMIRGQSDAEELHALVGDPATPPRKAVSLLNPNRCASCLEASGTALPAGGFEVADTGLCGCCGAIDEVFDLALLDRYFAAGATPNEIYMNLPRLRFPGQRSEGYSESTIAGSMDRWKQRQRQAVG
jgi:hypothetical protein